MKAGRAVGPKDIFIEVGKSVGAKV